MKGIAVALLVLLVLAASSPVPSAAQATPPVWRSRSTGDGAIGAWQVGSLWFYVSINRSAGEVWLWYLLVDMNTGTWFESGWGNIYPEQVTGSVDGVLALQTDTRTIPGFNIENGSGGIIDVRWRNKKIYWTETNGLARYKWYDGVTFIASGFQMWAAAEFSGTTLGYAVPDLPNTGGQVGKFRETTISISPPPRRP